MNRSRIVLLLAILVAAASQAQAAISLTPVTAGLGDMDTAVLAAAATVIALAVGWQGLKFGGKWVIKVFKSMAS
jgi:hypothetical protein